MTISFTDHRGSRVNISLSTTELRSRVAEMSARSSLSADEARELANYQTALAVGQTKAPMLDQERAARVSELERYSRLSKEQAAELAEHRSHLDARATARAQMERFAALPGAGESAESVERTAAERQRAADAGTRRPLLANPRAAASLRSVQLARTALDDLHRSGRLLDDQAVTVERMLNGTDQDPLGAETADWVRAAGSPDYLSAFAKRLADPATGHTEFTPAEAEAHRNAQQYARATLGLTGGAAMIPLTLDPAILLTNAGSTGGIRSLARQVPITTDKWSGVTSAGTTAEWKAESAEAADRTPAVAGKEVPVHLLACNALVSYELMADAMNFSTELARVLTDAAAVTVDAALANGTGVGQPTGVVTAGTATPQVGATAFSADDVMALQNDLPARFSAAAAFVGSLPVINEISSFETANGALRFPDAGAGTLLRRRLVEDSNIAADTATVGSKFLVYGDFSQYLIALRAGSSIQLLPNYGAAGRPTADMHNFLTLRIGADALVPNAFRVLVKS